MIALPHRRHVEPPKPVTPCGSDSYFWVTTPAGVIRASCGPHLTATLSLLYREGAQVSDLAPEPGTPCEWQEAS